MDPCPHRQKARPLAEIRRPFTEEERMWLEALAVEVLVNFSEAVERDHHTGNLGLIGEDSKWPECSQGKRKQAASGDGQERPGPDSSLHDSLVFAPKRARYQEERGAQAATAEQMQYPAAAAAAAAAVDWPFRGRVVKMTYLCQKQLYRSDVDAGQNRLQFRKDDVESSVLPLLAGPERRAVEDDINRGITVRVLDREAREYELVFKRWSSTKRYVFNGNQLPLLVRQNGLVEGVEVELYGGRSLQPEELLVFGLKVKDPTD